MSKIMSIFEKLNLVEKINAENTDSANAQEETYLKNIEEDKEEMEYKSSEPQNIDIQAPVNTEKQNNEIKPQSPETNEKEQKASDKVEFKQNKKMTIREIYSSYGLENSNINTVFMLGNFIKALPENLPYEVRKKSVISIIDSSNANLMNLLNDGKKRLDVLNQFSNNFDNTTTNIVEEYKNQISKLRKLIDSYEEQIQINQTLLKEQNNIIEYETDRIESIIDFFNKAE